MKDDEVGTGIGQRAGGMRDLVGQFGDGPIRLTGDPAARHQNAEAVRAHND